MINYYRLDTQCYNGIYGGKAEIAYKLCQNVDGIVTCGSRESVQVLTFAQMCDALNIPCQIHIPKGQETEMINKLKQTNTNIIYEKVGYNNVLNAHAKNAANELGYKFIPLGMIGCQEAIDIIKKNTSILLKSFPDTKRIVVPVGSGTTMVGICEYLYENNLVVPVLGISVGMDVAKILQKNTKYQHYNIIKSSVSYNHHVEHEFLNPIYEAKCVEFLKDNDTMYVVAK